MEIILREDVENLGLAYDVVEVKPGYARNFLIPNGKAVLATSKEKENLQAILDNLAKEQAADIKAAQQVVDQLKGVELKINAKSGSNGKLYGSINNANISEELEKLGISIDRKYIKVPGNNIKRAGKYIAKIRLHRDVNYDFEFEIIGEVEKSNSPSKNTLKEEASAKKVASDETNFDKKISIDEVVSQTKPKSMKEKETSKPETPEAVIETAEVVEKQEAGEE